MLFMLRRELRARGHDARVFVSDAGLSGCGESIDYTCRGTLTRFRTLLQAANPSAARSLRAALREFRPDLVHLRMFQTQLSPLVLRELRAYPTLYHVQWFGSICPKGTKLLPDGRRCGAVQGRACLGNRCVPARDWIPLMARMLLERRWRPAVDAVVTVSDAARRLLESEGLRVDGVVWNGVPERNGSVEPALYPLVGFAGRLEVEKGVDVLLRAFAVVAHREPSARLAIVGDGTQRRPLTQLVASLGLSGRVDLHGWLSRGEVERILGEAWVQVVPSLWEEPFGLVTAEALMRGTPVVATSAGGALDMIGDDERGLLVPPGDPDALGGAMLRVIGDRPLAAHLASRGRRFAVENLTPAACVDRLLGVYDRLLATAGAPARADTLS
jgi:glycosyltransferase involved in cell wall biosynthesis